MSIKEFTRFGYSYCHNQTVGTSYNSTGFALTADTSNSPSSLSFPAHCYIESIGLEASGVAAGENITIYLARDSAGAVPITTASLAGATQAPTIRTGTVGGYVYSVDKDFHFDSSVSNSTNGTLYLYAKTATGSVTVNIRINWRA